MFTKLIKNSELKGTIIITFGTIFGSFFAYLLQFFLGRLLSVEDYGTFNAFISLSTLINVPAGVFVVLLVKIVAELFGKEEFKKLTALFWKVSFFSFCYGLLLFSIVFLLRGIISSSLRVDSYTPIIVFGFFLGTGLFTSISRAYLQGLLRYKALAFFLTYSGFLRFLFPVILVFLGYSITGVFIGMGSGLILSYLISLLLLKKNFDKSENIDLSTQYKRFAHLVIPVAFQNFGLMALNNIDMILVKRFFEPEIAGYYAGTVTLGKILLFGAGSVTVIMFPQVSAAFVQGKNYLKNFKRLQLLQLFVVVCGVISYIVFPRLLTTLFFGNRFLNSVEYLPRFSLFIGLYVLVNFMVMFFLAIDKKNVFLFLLPGAVAQYILINLFHTTLWQVISVNIGVIAVVYLTLLIFFKRTLKYEKVKYNTP